MMKMNRMQPRAVIAVMARRNRSIACTLASSGFSRFSGATTWTGGFLSAKTRRMAASTGSTRSGRTTVTLRLE